MLSPTSAFTATTPKSKLSKSPRRDSLVAFEAKPECVRESVRAARGRSAHVDPEAERSVRARTRHEARGHELLGASPSRDEIARRADLVVKLKARSRPPHDLQRVHQRRTPWPKAFRWPNKDR